MENYSKITFVLSSFFFLLFFLFLSNFQPIINYTIVYLSSSLIFIILCFLIFKTDFSNKNIFILITLSLILRIIFISVQPIGSDDYYRYLWDGKVIANGINPYKYSADAEELTNLHSEVLPSKVNHANLKTVYPPLSIIIFYFSYILFGESYIGIKIFLLLFEIITFISLYLILKKLKFPLKNILIYALCPLPIFQFFIDAHVDGFGISLLALSILFYLDKKIDLSLIFTGLSICIKPVGILLLPIYFLNERNLKEKIKVVVIPILTCGIFYLPFIFTGKVFEALTNFTVNWTFNGFIFDLLNFILNDNQKTRFICGIIFLIIYLLIIFSKQKLLDKIYLSIFFLLIFSPVVHPWYAVWLAVLLPFIPKKSGIAFTGLISLTVFTILIYQTTSVWNDYIFILLLEYLPVVFIFVREFYKPRKRTIT